MDVNVFHPGDLVDFRDFDLNLSVSEIFGK